jgi:ABC-2 type transport system ATP-binding protein
MQMTEPPPAEETAATAAISCSDLKKSYGKFEALQGVTLDVPPAAIYGLLGPNGAGKTTLIKALVGASLPTSGQVNILGLDPVRQARKLRPQIGYMPQAPALYDDLSTRDNARFFARAYGLEHLDRAVEEAIEFVALGNRQNDPVYAFSGGMKQRASLACALVHNPRVLFLDEPTAGVDPALKEGFWKHFRELASRGVTLFISTHLMDEALLCDQLTILRAGQVLTTAPPADIMQRGRTEVVVWRSAERTTDTIRYYYFELPGVLQRFGLDPAVTRIELHEDSLETVILSMIEEPGE